MRNIIFTLLAFICVFPLSAQIKTYEKAKIEFNKKNYKGANKLIDKCLENPETKKNSNVLLLKSKIQFAIFKDKTINEKFPNALKDALKFADKAIDEIEAESAKVAFRTANKEYLDAIISQNNKEAMDAYNTNRFTKALPIFKRSLNFGLDTQSLVLIGECYWQMNQRPESLNYFKQAATIIYAAVLDSNSKIYGYHKLPFRRLGKYYIDKEQYDTAYIIVKNGREILPSDPELSNYTYNLMRYALEKIPPSDDYLRMVQQSLKDFPSDSFLNHRENSIYIFLLNGMAKAGEVRQFDSLLNIFTLSKLEKAKLKQVNLIKKYDIFAGLDKQEFLNKFYKYVADIGLFEASSLTFRSFKGFPNSYGTFYDQIAYERPFYADILYSYFIKQVPQINDKRVAYTTNLNKSAIGYYDLMAMIHLNDESDKNSKSPVFMLKAKELRMKLIKEASDSNDFVLARKIWKEASLKYPDMKKNLDDQLRVMVVADFKKNYFGSRINPKGKIEKDVPQYYFNGDVDNCKPGKMSDTVVLRLERRINYFRRMAGIPNEIILTNDFNENCEIAALMCEANKSMSHSPNDAWRCFIPAGFDALKLSILSRDGNPAIAITAAMGQNHTTVGNRRWLLYPYAQYMGIGTSINYTSILAVDHTNKADSVKYKNSFIAWPPEGYSPKMTLYKKWSFSIDRKLTGATVTMKNGKGENIALKIEPLANGYGLNTLVWEPEINAATLADNEEFTVTVKLGDGKIFTYKVTIIDVKP
ncbi:MAG: hypothetical protein V4613_10220 [Bacteroidota bacterium]